MKITPEVKNAIAPLVGKPCCLQHTDINRGLCIGFGKKISHKKKASDWVDMHYGEWEIRFDYASTWRIIKKDKIVCGSRNLESTWRQLDEELTSIKLGKFVSLEQLTKFDIRINLDNDMQIDFISASTEYDDQVIHIYGPENLIVSYTVLKGWGIEKADKVHWL